MEWRVNAVIKGEKKSIWELFDHAIYIALFPSVCSVGKEKNMVSEQFVSTRESILLLCGILALKG
jgi:hypothetical protein